MSEARKRAYRGGLLAETVAAWLYRLQGYRILARRHRTRVGEIDLIVARGERIAFVEVKRRRTYEAAAFSVTAKQKRRIVRAAQYWLANRPDLAGRTIAFDVVLIAPFSFPQRIENAFEV